jgi:D-amino-acid dehydrogenase
VAKHILIVGGGVVGLSTAYYAARKGHRVTVLDQAAPYGDGCSYGNAGMVVPSHLVPLAAPGMVALGLRWMWNTESPFYIAPRLDRDLLAWGVRFWRAANTQHVVRAAPLLRDLHLASRACFEDLAALWGNGFGLVKKGLLMLCRTERGLEEEARTAEQASRLGMPASVLDATQTAALEPSLRMDVVGSVYFPMDCHLTPGRFMAALTRELDRSGARLSWDTAVTGWRVNGRRVEAVRTTRGEIEADEYVLCAGVWSTDVARDLGLTIPMQAGKGYGLTLRNPGRLPSRCIILSEARVTLTPMGSALRVGGTMELAGIDLTINPARVRGIVKAVPRYLPEFGPDDFAGVPAWCGLRPCPPDGLPYVGRTARYANLSTATGHAMMGLSLGPITGKLMAEILCGEEPSLDIEALNPDRYSPRGRR